MNLAPDTQASCVETSGNILLRRPFRRRVARLAMGALVILLLATLAGGLWIRGRLGASLPRLDGEAPLAGLSRTVLVQRDELGVPTVRAANQVDAARALGFLHGQERFFQMDLLRRAAAGELAELLGPAVLDADRAVRIHRLRRTADRATALVAGEERDVLDAYVAGVNAGLSALAAPPWEYLLLRTPPRRWASGDTVLVLLAMFLTLQDSEGEDEARLGLLHDVLPPALAAFLTPMGTDWDAALDGSPAPVPVLPGPEVLDLRRRQDTTARHASGPVPDVGDWAPGSNNWAVAGTHTHHGGALLADDMHLPLRMPNIWYRASLTWPGSTPSEPPWRVTGVTLPGTPALVAGSNGHVAWGFTNAQVDTGDLVVLEPSPGAEDSYLTPEGPRRIEHVQETILVRGGEAVTLDIRQSIWGPVVGTDHRGRRRAFRWVAHEPEAVNLGLLGLATATTLGQALDLANRAGIPAQNLLGADDTGRIGWTIAGRLPRRVGFDGRRPVSSSGGSHRWDGWLAPEEVPRIVDPANGRLWTANNRVVGGEALAALGDGGYGLGARAGQIRDGLLALSRAGERDLHALQLDDRALFLARWHELALTVLTPAATASSPQRAELRGVLQSTWTSRASVESAAYRLVRELRIEVARRVLGPLTAPCQAVDKEFEVTRLQQAEGPLWRLLQERPLHLLDPAFASWDELLLASLDTVAARAIEASGALAAHTWGRRNTVRIRHPLSGALPGLARWLDGPAGALPGDSHMPRVQGQAFGASERFVVSPGRETEGLFHMPGGQSGHPLSPFYRAGHGSWAEGKQTPFLPGPPVHTLRLVP